MNYQLMVKTKTPMKAFMQKFLLLLLLVYLPLASANTLENVDFSSMPGNKLQIVLTLAEPPAVKPVSFSTDSPARIAVDLDGVSSALKNRTTNIGLGMARSITAVEASGKTRVVLSLAGPVGYDIKTNGNLVLINVDGGAMQAAESASAGGFKTKSGGNLLETIDFKRGEKGKAEVILQMTNEEAIVDMHYEGGKLVLDLMNTELKPELSRLLDVSDFATPVRSIETRVSGNNVKITVDAEGDYDHLAYQADGSYVLEVRPLTKQEVEQSRLEKQVFTGDRLSLNFQDIEVRSVLQLLADFTGLNMVVSDSVGGSVTLRLKNVPWDQAMDIILKTKGLSMRQNDNVIMVAPSQEIDAWEKTRLEQMQVIEELSPLRTELIEINYADAAGIATLLDSASNTDDEENRLLSSRGQVTVDPRTNSLLILETSKKLEEIRALIAKLDVPVKQVMIESRIVIASDDFTKELGVRLGLESPEGATARRTRGSWESRVSGSLDGDIDGVTDGNLLVDLAPAVAYGGVDLVLAKIGSSLLTMELSAMQREGKGEILSNPRIITANNNAATIEQGLSVPYQSESESGGTTTEFVDATLKMEVTPQITPDDRVILDLNVQNDNPASGTDNIETRSLQTNVVVDNGETVVLGGVFQQEKSRIKESVPFFGDLPMVGVLFKTNYEQNTNRELLIFVTPQIVKESLTQK